MINNVQNSLRVRMYVNVSVRAVRVPVRRGASRRWALANHHHVPVVVDNVPHPVFPILVVSIHIVFGVDTQHRVGKEDIVVNVDLAKHRGRMMHDGRPTTPLNGDQTLNIEWKLI